VKARPGEDRIEFEALHGRPEDAQFGLRVAVEWGEQEVCVEG